MRRESDNENIVAMVKKPRVSKSCDDSGDKESGSGVEKEKKEKARLFDFDLNVEDVGFDLNVPSVEAGVSGNDSVDEKMLGVIDITSDERLVGEILLDFEHLSFVKGGQVEDSWLSLAYDHAPLQLGRSFRSTALRKSELRRLAVEFARFNPKEHHSQETVNIDANLFTGDGPFSVALRNIVEQNVIQKCKPLTWSPSKGGRRKSSPCVVPSLLELSMKELANNAAAIDSLEGVPFILRKRLADLICSSRSMNAKTLDLFVRGSPIQICIKDCNWLTQDQFSTAFGNIDVKNLMVLQLELCGQCNFDYVVGQTVAGSLNSLPNLAILSLKGASRLTDDAVKALVIAAPALQSINLSQCSLLTEEGINFIADAIGTTLKELYIDECQSIHAMLIETALLKFKNLEVLSVAGIQTVCDKLVESMVSVFGKTLKELNLADCPKLTNYSLQVIASTCSSLHALNISKLHQLTDISLEYLANGCQLIQSLTLLGNRFSDEVIAAFLETSGMNMKNLSLNKVSKVGYNTTTSLAEHSRGLLSLDLSWCRRVSNDELGLIVDCCLSLRLLKLFGCSQITEVFLNGHSNTQVRIVGLTNTSLLAYMDDLKPEELLLRYS